MKIMIIRKANINDFEDLLGLHLQIEDTEISFDSNLKPHAFDTDEGKKKIKKQIKDENYILLVCEENNNQVVGFIDGEVMEPSIVYYDKVAFLNHICVDKKYRRKGIGDLLFLAFQDEVAKQNAKYIRVLAFPKNTPAVSFYNKHNLLEYSVYYQKKIM